MPISQNHIRKEEKIKLSGLSKYHFQVLKMLHKPELVDSFTDSSAFAEIAYTFFVNSQLIYTRSAQNKNVP